MSLASRLLLRSARSSARAFSTTTPRLAESVPLNSRSNDTAKKHREFMLKKPLNPHMTNTNSTIANDFPSVGKDKPPADQITSVDPNYIPKDSVPENTERMTGGTQPGGPTSGPNAELDVGEIEGGKFRVAPLRREGESDETLRARLIYQSRKRGTLESDLLLSTFAREYLPKLSRSQLEAFDRFLDENDWDIYYWATQTAPPTSHETAEGGSPSLATPAAAGADSTTAAKGTGVDAEELSRAAESGRAAEEATAKASNPSQGEWRYTIGTFKPAYRPVPSRWKNSEILSLLRKHVLEKSAGGVVVEGEAGQGGGLGMMPDVDHYKRTASKA